MQWVLYQTRRRRHGRKLDIKLLVLDVSRAHFHPPAVRELYITLPDEDATPGMVGQLLRTLYGTRDAAHEWDDFANTKISAVGYQVGMSNPCLYMHGTEPSIGWRHGDDILFAGEENLLTVSMTSWKVKWSSRNEHCLGLLRKMTNTAQSWIDSSISPWVKTDRWSPTSQTLDTSICCLNTWGLKGQRSKVWALQVRSPERTTTKLSSRNPMWHCTGHAWCV